MFVTVWSFPSLHTRLNFASSFGSTDCKPASVSNWSFDESCLYCCLRREKVKVVFFFLFIYLISLFPDMPRHLGRTASICLPVFLALAIFWTLQLFQVMCSKDTMLSIIAFYMLISFSISHGFEYIKCMCVSLKYVK